MEKSLDELNIINKPLIKEKNKIKNKLYEKIINSDYYLESKSDEHTLMKKASVLINDEEYEKLRLRYEKLKSLTNTIIREI